MEGRFTLPFILAILLRVILIVFVADLIMLAYGPSLWLSSDLKVFNQLLKLHALPLLSCYFLLQCGDFVEHAEEAIVHLSLLLAITVDFLLLIVVL